MHQEQTIPELSPSDNWYAMKVFHSKTAFVESYLEQEGVYSWVPMQKKTVRRGERKVTIEVPMLGLLFLHCSDQQIRELRWALNGRVMIYHEMGAQAWKPKVVPDFEVRQFERLVAYAADKLSIFDGPVESFNKGDRVRITGGNFAGFEGYIKRIGGNKRLVIVIEGILAVAATYIPSCFVEKIQGATL